MGSRDGRNRFGYFPGKSPEENLKFYEELNEAGRAYVDRMAARVNESVKARGRENLARFGDEAARELVIAILRHFWAG